MGKYFLLLLILLNFISCKRSKDTSKSSTAQANVIILEKDFEIRGLDRIRKIRIFLPKRYKESTHKYPVLYMHDAQNLFDNSTSYAGEWGIDESLNQLSRSSNLDFIVVGIDNGQDKRMNELSPWENKKFGNAEGEKYMEFIVKQIKPFIDSRYRTFSDRENTAVMGSSMGGLISHYAIYKYPEIFGKAAIFSASYWYSDEVYDFTRNNSIPDDTRLFLMVGKKEASMVNDTQKMFDVILQTGHPASNVSLNIDVNGEHNEASWRKQFIPAIKYLFAK